MNGKLAAFVVLPAILSLPACGGSTASGADPQAPSPNNPKNAAATVVICPDGSTYDPTRNACIATSGTPNTATPKDAKDEQDGQVSVQVKCDFRNGWVAVVPESDYPEDDEFIMQALIGFTEEPDFWRDQTQHAPLAKYAAKRCNSRGERFNLRPGSYFVLVGESGTFGQRGAYRNNGYRRHIDVSRGDDLDIDLSGDDLNHTWYCISCPYVSFFDPSLGTYLPSFVVLAYRDERKLRGTDRIVVHEVPVRDGKIRLRVNEVEPEVSYLDQLVLEVDGKRVLPSRGGSRSALADADGVHVEMAKGTQVVVEYDVPHVQGSTTTVTVIAHGHYEPTLPN